MKDPFDKEKLISWLSKKKPEEEYNYQNTSRCLLAQYFKFRRFGFTEMAGTFYTDKKGNEHDLSPSFIKIACGLPYTFGAALARAKELQ